MNNLGAALAAARQFDDAIAAQEQAIALLRTAARNSGRRRTHGPGRRAARSATL